MGGRRRRRRNDISRYSLNEYVRKRVDAIENNPFAFSYATPSASYRGKFVEKVEDSYASLASYAYRGDSVVAACMRVRRDLFRQAKFCWREIDEAGPGKIFRTDELELLDKPWPNGTTGELLARMITDIDLCGNSFIHQAGDRLRWLRPDWVSIVLSGDPQVDIDIDVLGYVYTPGGLDPEKNGHAYSPDEICHWAPEQDPLAFYRGMSWVSKALEEVQGDRAATTHKVAFFRNGATLGPIVRVPAGTSMQQFKEFMAAAEEAHAGAHNAYRTMYLGGGAEVTLAAADFRQLDLKSVQGGMETRIAAVAGVHPVLVGLSEGLAGSSLNSGNFAAARRATAEMTLYSLWQDACGALEAFFKVPDQAELWIRERDIPFLREEARDRAEIFKTQVLAIEAAMRAGFKPDPAVQATLEERLDLLIGAHTGLFSVQMQPPQSGMEGAPPLDVNGDGQPEPPGTPIDFGALRADLWGFDDEEIERAVEEAFGDFDDEVVRDRYDVRVPKGFEGGGRFRKLSDRLVALLGDWAKGEGDDDPLDEYSRDQLRRVAKELADKARADGDNERAARLTPRRGASSDEIKLALYKDVRAHVRGERDRKLDNPRLAKFTLQQPGKLHDKDIAVYRMPGDKPALFHETDSGKRGGLVERFDDLDGLAAWADEHGETRLAEWARKEAGGKAPAPKAAKRVPPAPGGAPRGEGVPGARAGGKAHGRAETTKPSGTSPRIDVQELAADLGFGESSDASINERDARMLATVQSALDGNAEPALGVHRPGQGTPASIGRGLERWATGSVGPYYHAATMTVRETDPRHLIHSVIYTPEEIAAHNAGVRADIAVVRQQGDRWVALAKKLQATRRPARRGGPDVHPRETPAKKAPLASPTPTKRTPPPSPAPAKKAPRGKGAPTMSEAGGIGDGTQTHLRPVSTAGTTPLAERVAEQLKSGEITPAEAAAMLGATGTEAPGRVPADLPAASDPEALRDALDLRTVDQLKAMLRERGLPVSGRKRELVDRLVAGGGVGPKGEPAKATPAKPTGRTPATPVPIRDLFDADDATIETALKDVFEGKFGPYTTKASVSVQRAGTRTDSRGRVHEVEPSIIVAGKIYDADGNKIGHFGRDIGPVDLHYQDGTVRREMWANHSIVELGEGDYDENPTKYHGKGFGGEFNRRAIQWYRDSGVHGISQHDHNGYVWASQGFNFGRGGRVPDYLQEDMRELIADLRAGKRTSNATKDEYRSIPKRFRDASDLDAQIAAAEALLARLNTTKPGEPGYPTAYEISQLGRRAGQRGKTALWFGKLLFVSADEMILNPDEGEVISQ